MINQVSKFLINNYCIIKSTRSIVPISTLEGNENFFIDIPYNL